MPTPDNPRLIFFPFWYNIGQSKRILKIKPRPLAHIRRRLMNIVLLLALATVLAVSGAFAGIDWTILLGILIILIALLGPGFVHIIKQIQAK